MVSLFLGKEVETLDDTQMGDPVNDSSPSGSDKPTFMSSPIDAVLLHEGNYGLKGLDVTVEVSFC